MRVFEDYGGREVFAGEAEIGDRPVGLPIELTIGRAQNVHARDDHGFGTYGAPRAHRNRVVVMTEHRIVNKSVPIELEIRHAVESYLPNVEGRSHVAADAPQVR